MGSPEIADIVGSTLGRYRIVKAIGVGGMGAVYLAEHELLGRKAAIKVLHPDLADEDSEEAVQRFFNEAKASTAIEHPGIVQVFDYGYCEAGNAYIVMELLRGETLGARLARDGRLPIEHAIRIAAHCASALGAAHEAGIVHRDLKPGNIFLVKDPQVEGGQRAKILDFGIAKLSAKGQVSTTQSGTFMGTPIYAAPEQCVDARTVDHHADIYSLGCVLFHMLCGRPPFFSESMGALIGHHLTTPPPPARGLNPLISAEYEAIVARCLAKAPAARYASMEQLCAALEGREALSDAATRQGEPESLNTDDVPTAWMQTADLGPADAAARADAVKAGAARAAAGAGDTGGTISGSAGEAVSAPPTGERRSFALYATVIAVSVLFAVGGTLIYLSGKRSADGDPDRSGKEPPALGAAAGPGDQATGDDHRPAAPAPTDAGSAAGEKPSVVVRIESEPPGARVILQTDDGGGKPLGITPYDYESAESDQPVTVQLDLSGYEIAEVSFAADGNRTERVAMRPKKRRPRKGSRSSSGGKGDGTSKSGEDDSSPTTKGGDDDPLSRRH